MLKIVNLKKIYKNKKGLPVKALDGVTLSFKEKGMVFLLGKSGSGKSTLLNLCGGLDSPTEGEIIIKGRSSKDFTQGDFDSYRNTFVGFVFQEYNILNEFSVENNIALALELQGKPKDKESIEKILKEVDLEGYGKRKPNTLSGGQKQRIAIARALIKNPEIIMADEPTGALDSTTSKQVFDTLKKLSEKKLVLVVSHDREFAKEYADRIIELKDGKVINDISKTIEKETSINNNVSIVGDNFLCVKDGEKLTENDFLHIKAFLKKNKNSIICNDENEVKAVKKLAHINEDGKETFITTKEEENKKEYSLKDSKFIKSHLPMHHAFTIGLSGLKSKPIRLFMTIMLCSFAFALFGLLSTMMLYDGNKVFTKTMMQSDYDYIKAQKQYNIHEKYYEGNTMYSDYSFKASTNISKTELNELKTEFGNNSFGAKAIYAEISNISKKLGNTSYYSTSIINAAYLEEDNAYRNNINGKYPEKNNEIAISNYIAEGILQAGLNDAKDKKYDINTINDIIGKIIILNGKEYTVTGIFDSGEIKEEYDTIKESDNYDWQLYGKFTQELENGLHQVAFVSKDEMSSLKINEQMLYEIFNSTGNMVITDKEDNIRSYIQYAKYSSNKNMFNINYFNNKNTLDDNEVVVSLGLIMNMIDIKYDTLSYNEKTLWDSKIREQSYKIYIEEEKNKLTNEQITTYKNDLIKFINDTKILENIEIKAYDNYNGNTIDNYSKKVSVIGYFDVSNNDFLLASDEFYNEFEEKMINTYKETGMYFTVRESSYVSNGEGIYDVVYLEYDKTEEKTNSLIPYLTGKDTKDNASISLSNSLALEILSINEMVSEISKVFLYLGIIVAVFAILLLSNFISVSISNKTKEIGILRAVGARSIDVFKIFFSESFIISTICIILSIIGGIIACNIFNNTIGDVIGVNLFVFGILSILIIIIIAIITTVLATLIPVYNAAKKKPVDSIRSM